MRNPRDFFKPLAIDAPEPLREIPVVPSRMIHFLDFSNEKMVAKVPAWALPANVRKARTNSDASRRTRGSGMDDLPGLTGERDTDHSKIVRS